MLLFRWNLFTSGAYHSHLGFYTFILLSELRARNFSLKTVRISSTVISWFLLIVLSTNISTFGFSDKDANVSVSVFGKFGDFHDSVERKNKKKLFWARASNLTLKTIA